MLRETLAAYGGLVWVVAVTAPGRDVLPQEADGRCCRGPLKRWHDTYCLRFRELDKIATKAARRVCPGWRRVANVGEAQRRGAAHRHLVLPMQTPGERAGSQAWVRAWEAHRHDWGFGFADKHVRVGPAAGAHGYLSKYLGKQLDERPAIPGHVVTVSTRLRERCGVTVSGRRRLRRRWMRLTGCERQASRRAAGRPACGLRMADARALLRAASAAGAPACRLSARRLSGVPARPPPALLSGKRCELRWAHGSQPDKAQGARLAPAPRAARSPRRRGDF